MFKNFIKVTFRNMFKHKGYSFINIAGLAAGLACCLLISIWVLDELSFDRFHDNASAIYRVEEDQHYTGRIFHVTVTPYPLGPALVEEIPEIIDAARYVWAGGQLLRYGENAFFENNIRAVDPSFLNMFSFPLKSGSVENVLNDPHSLVITEAIAEKYFGREEALGKVINVNNTHSFTVTGILADIPDNSSLQFNILIPYLFLEKSGRTSTHFGSNSIQTFVQLDETASRQAADEKIFGFIRTRVPESKTDLMLKDFTRMHLHSYWGYNKNAGAVQYVTMFSVIAFFVLLIACINFMNLATARSAGRAKEVGLRKVVGAFRSHLVRQFYGESLMFAFIALGLALIIVTLILPAFGTLTQKSLGWSVAGRGELLIGLVAITLLTGLIAGSYPALLLSSFQPIKVLKGSFKTGRAGARFRKILVVVQFSLSVLLIIGTTVVYRQMNFMKSKNIGWDREHVVYTSLRGGLQQNYEALKTEMAKDSSVLNVTGTEQLPTNIGSNSSNADWDGKDPDFTTLIGYCSVDFDYIETLRIEMMQGRAFSREYPSDEGKAWVVNEETANLMEKESVIGERFDFQGVKGTIIGVMKNFHYQSVRTNIEPLALIVAPQQVNYLMLRLAPGDVTAGMNAIERVWKRVVPNYPFEISFLDDIFDDMYRSEERMVGLLKYFAGLAILIACLGLFGLANFMAEQRTKEIGIRKVLGASVPGITGLLCRDFLFLVLAANVLAWPAAFFLMNGWLRSYAYRVELSLWIFVGAMMAAVLVAVASVGYQAVRAASANPASSLKYE